MKLPLISSLWRKFCLWRKSKKLARFKRTPRVFVPTGSRWWIVIPYKPIGVILIVFLLATTVYLVFRSDMFLVRDLAITEVTEKSAAMPEAGPPLAEGTEKIDLVNEKEVREILSSCLARSIFSINTSGIEKKLLEHILAIESVKIEKVLPGTLKVKIFERVPLAVLKIKKIEEVGEGKKLEYSQFFLVDKKGLIFAKVVKKPPLPEFELEKEIAEGEILGKKIEAELISSALKIVEGFAALDFVKPTSFVISQNGEILVSTDAGWKALFRGETDSDCVEGACPEPVEGQIASLQAIVTKAKIEGRSIKRIDLRFKRPVVEY